MSLVLAIFAACSSHSSSSWPVITPEQHGAVADGRSDDTAAIQAAIAACSRARGGCTLLFAGVAGYCTGPQWINASNVALVVQAGSTIRAVNRTRWIRAGYRYNATDCCYPAVLNFEDVANITLSGGGVIDGEGGSGEERGGDENTSSWWGWTWSDKKHAPGTLNDYRPHLTRFSRVRGLRVGGGLTLMNSPNHHIWLEDSVAVRIGGVGGGLRIFAPALQGAGLPGVDFYKGSPNTDGINVAGGTDTLIEGVEVHNNDDCVSVVASTSWVPHNPVAGDHTDGYGGDVSVRNISCTYSHGLSIGSVTHGVIRNVTFEDVKFDRSDNGCRIKSHANGTGLVADIIYRNISVSNVLWPIIVDGFYGAGKEGKTAVHFRNLSFAGIRGQAFSGAKFHCDPDYPCQGISLQDVDLQLAKHGIPRDWKFLGLGKDVKMKCENAAGTAVNVKPASCL